MNILKSLFGSDSDLSRPDIKRFRDVVVDLSSNILAMPDVKHTAMYSISAFPEDSDIYNLRNFYESKGNVYALRVYERGWPHKGYRASSIGSTVLTITLMHFPEQSHPKLNFFDQSDLEISILKLCNEFWACNNTGAKLGSLGSADHVYPVKSEDFQYKEFNSTRWLVANIMKSLNTSLPRPSVRIISYLWISVYRGMMVISITAPSIILKKLPTRP